MNAVLKELYASSHVRSRSGKVFPLFPTSIGWHKGVSLYEWIRRSRPRVTLEIGFAFGASTLFMCQALEENGVGHHHVVDPWQATVWDSCGLERIERAGLSHRLTFYEAPSYRQLPRLLEQQLAFDFAFIDGQHLVDYVLLDCFYADLLLPVEGVMALDDVWMASVRKVVRFLLSNRAYRLVRYTNRLLGGRPASPWLLRFMERALRFRHGAAMVHPLFRWEGLVYLQKTQQDARAWDWYREF